MESVRIRRAGFPERKPCQVFVAAYTILVSPKQLLLELSPLPFSSAEDKSDDDAVLRNKCRAIFNVAAKLHAQADSLPPQSPPSSQAAIVEGPRAQFGRDGQLWMKDGFLRWMDESVG